MSCMLVVIVEKDREQDIFEALHDIGIRNFTRLQGTGTGLWQTVDRTVDPEKVFLLSVIQADQAEEAMKALHEKAGLDEDAARGIAFTVPVEMGIGAGIPREPT